MSNDQKFELISNSVLQELFKSLDIELSSFEFQRGVDWLKSFVDDEKPGYPEIKEIEKIIIPTNEWDLKIDPAGVTGTGLVYAMYTLSLLNSDFQKIVQPYFEKKHIYVGSNDFILFCIQNDPQALVYMWRLNVFRNKIIEVINPMKMIDDLGKPVKGEWGVHFGVYWLICEMGVDNKICERAKDYSIGLGGYCEEPIETAVAILASLNNNKFNPSEIQKGVDFLKENQEIDGEWSNIGITSIYTTSFCLQALVRVLGRNDEVVEKGKKYILKNQNKDGGWAHDLAEYSFPKYTATSILALLECGDGPKIGWSDYYRIILKRNNILENIINPNGCPNEIQNTIQEANICYNIELYTACAVLMRKILQNSIVIRFKMDKKENILKDNNGDYYELPKLIELAKKEGLFNSQICKRLLNLKFLGDTAAHSYHITMKEGDITEMKVCIRIALESLFY